MKITKIVMPILAMISIVSLTSCGEKVEVNTAHVGFVKTKTGVEDEVKEPSSFRLPFSFSTNPQLIEVEVSDFSKKEDFQLYLPKDNLTVSFDVRGMYSIKKDKARGILDRIPTGDVKGSEVTISSDKVYDVYARQVIRTTTREVMSNYTISEILTNRSNISKLIFDSVTEILNDTPIRVSLMSLASVNPPQVVILAQEKAVQREIELQEAEADKMVQLKKAEARLEVAKKQQSADLIEAETQVLVEKKLSESVSQAFVTQRSLKVMETMATSQNKVFIIPTEAFQNPSLMMGINNKAIK